MTKSSWRDDPRRMHVDPENVYRLREAGTINVTHAKSGRRGTVVGVLAENRAGDEVSVVIYQEDVDVIHTLQMEIDEKGMAVRANDPQ